MSHSTEKKKLVLITDEFPNSLGESSFVPPELPFLLDRFHVTVVCKSASKTCAVEVDPRVQVLHYSRPGPVSHIPGLFSVFIDADFCEERALIRQSGKQRALRLAVSAYFIAEARLFDRYLAANGFYGERAPDLFYSYWNNYAVYALTCAKAAGRTNARIVTRTHGYDLYDVRQPGGRQPMKRPTDRGLDRVFFVSAQGRDYYLAHHAGKEAPEKYALARMGTAPLSPCPRPAEGAPLCLLTCSRTAPVKRLDLLIRALACITDVPVRWTHVGSGTELSALESLSMGLLSEKPNITYTFAGQMTNPDYLSLLQKGPFSCLVNVSSSEGLPVTMMEAASASLPIVATDVGGVHEIVGPENGILIPSDPSPEEIASALCGFYALPETQKAALSDGARRVWAERFDAKRNYRDFSDALLSLACSKNENE